MMAAFAELEKKLLPQQCPGRIPSTKKGIVTQTQCNKPVAEGSDCCHSCTKTSEAHDALWKNGEYRVEKLQHLGPLGLGWHGIHGGLFPWYSRALNDNGTKRNRDESSEPRKYTA
jgi:hypothetical protein